MKRKLHIAILIVLLISFVTSWRAPYLTPEEELNKFKTRHTGSPTLVQESPILRKQRLKQLILEQSKQSIPSTTTENKSGEPDTAGYETTDP